MNPGFCKGSPIFVITGGWMEKMMDNLRIVL